MGYWEAQQTARQDAAAASSQTTTPAAGRTPAVGHGVAVPEGGDLGSASEGEADDDEYPESHSTGFGDECPGARNAGGEEGLAAKAGDGMSVRSGVTSSAKSTSARVMKLKEVRCGAGCGVKYRRRCVYRLGATGATPTHTLIHSPPPHSHHSPHPQLRFPYCRCKTRR